MGKTHNGSFKAARQIRHHHIGRRCLRMKINGGIQSLRRLKYFPVLGIIEVFSLGMRIDDHAIQLEFFDAPLHLFRRSFGVLRCDRGQAGESIGMFLDGLCQLIVG